MRKAFSPQSRLDGNIISQVQLNLNCRDEIVPILQALKHVYSRPQLRDDILQLIARDVNPDSRIDRGREGLDYWQILVLAGVRLGCDLDYDKLQDLAEQHRALRQVMGIGDWQGDAKINFSWRRIRDNICRLQPATIDQISHLLVAAGHQLASDAAKKVRVDSFVVETNIHYPTESSLIEDGMRKIIKLAVELADEFNLPGWRQHQHLLKNIQRITRQISRIAARKGTHYEQRLQKQYRLLLRQAKRILRRAGELCEAASTLPAAAVDIALQTASIKHFMALTGQVCGTAERRVLRGETVPNEEKLLSIFEPHTQLYKRGKAGEPMQFGRLLLVYEDAAGFLVHQHVMDRDAQDVDVAVAQTRVVQDRLQNAIAEISFDCGFHSPANQSALSQIVPRVCLPKKGQKQSAEQAAAVDDLFRASRRRHPGVESAIGALQSGNGLERCRDKTELGFARYVSLAIFGRNLHVLGKLLIAAADAACQAAYHQRQAA